MIPFIVNDESFLAWLRYEGIDVTTLDITRARELEREYRELAFLEFDPPVPA